MAKVCSICRHNDRERIDEALLNSEPYRAIAARTGTSIAALSRHGWQHVPARLVNAKQVAEEIRAESFKERFDAIKRAASAILADALQSGNHGIALQAMARIEKQLNLEAALLTKLSEQLKNALGIALERNTPRQPDLSLLTTEELRTVTTILEKTQPKPLLAA